MPRSPRLLLLASSTVIGLVFPGAVHSAPDGEGGYVVEPGDYLFGIAREQGVTLRDLLEVNGLTLTSVIHPGQRLALPASVSSSTTGSGTHSPTTGSGTNRPTTGSGMYTVRSGDYLYGIARRHGVPLGSLLTANGLTLTSFIHPGQQLAIPAGDTSSAPASGTTTLPAPPSTASAPVGGPPSTTSPTPVSAADVERIIREVWPDHLEEKALAIAWRESRYQSAAQNACCSGLFQLYYDVHRAWLTDLGIDSREDLYAPRTNAEAAFALYQRAGGWGPWSQVAD